MNTLLEPPIRAEYELAPAPRTEQSQHGSRRAPGRRSLGRGLLETGWVRKGLLLVVIAILWEAVARWQNNDLLLPGVVATAKAFYEGIVSGELLGYVGVSLWVLVQGYGAGILGAFLLTSLAVSTRFGRDLLETLTAMFNPLPAIALLPLALLWFGLGKGSLIFVLMHSVMWPLALNTYAGFRSVPETLRMAGRNYGLGGVGLVFQILIPAALPAILSGLKIGWAFAWRTLIAAELVFGTTSGKGGLGWYIFQSRNELYTDKVFAGLAMVIIIGLLVENIVFQTAEKVTIRRWGMQR
jgi:NitT/TauT family transport system permease protein